MSAASPQFIETLQLWHFELLESSDDKQAAQNLT